jgi:RPA family protein
VARNREVAWRIFADEYNSSSVEMRDEGEYAPAYVLTPLGALVNRVFTVGVLTEVENMGTEEEPLYRARLQDSTGVFYVSAGQYQPEAAKVLGALPWPSFVAVVGKTRTYSPEEGLVYVSLRPEVIKQVGAEERDLWTLEAGKSTLARIEACRDAQAMEEPSEEELIKLGHAPKLARGVVSAIEAYGQVDLGRYERVVADALSTLRSGELGLPPTPTHQGALAEEEGPVREGEGEAPEDGEQGTDAASAPSDAATPTGAATGPPQTEDDMDDMVLSLVRELDEGAKGAAYDAILERARDRGLDRDSFEETINRLLDQGLIYEPILGQIKLI